MMMVPSVKSCPVIPWIDVAVHSKLNRFLRIEVITTFPLVILNHQNRRLDTHTSFWTHHFPEGWLKTVKKLSDCKPEYGSGLQVGFGNCKQPLGPAALSSSLTHIHMHPFVINTHRWNNADVVTTLTTSHFASLLTTDDVQYDCAAMHVAPNADLCMACGPMY